MNTSQSLLSRPKSSLSYAHKLPLLTHDSSIATASDVPVQGQQQSTLTHRNASMYTSSLSASSGLDIDDPPSCTSLSNQVEQDTSILSNEGQHGFTSSSVPMLEFSPSSSNETGSPLTLSPASGHNVNPPSRPHSTLPDSSTSLLITLKEAGEALNRPMSAPGQHTQLVSAFEKQEAFADHHDDLTGSGREDNEATLKRRSFNPALLPQSAQAERHQQQHYLASHFSPDSSTGIRSNSNSPAPPQLSHYSPAVSLNTHWRRGALPFGDASTWLMHDQGSDSLPPSRPLSTLPLQLPPQLGTAFQTSSFEQNHYQSLVMMAMTGKRERAATTQVTLSPAFPDESITDTSMADSSASASPLEGRPFSPGDYLVYNPEMDNGSPTAAVPVGVDVPLPLSSASSFTSSSSAGSLPPSLSPTSSSPVSAQLYPHHHLLQQQQHQQQQQQHTEVRRSTSPQMALLAPHPIYLHRTFISPSSSHNGSVSPDPLLGQTASNTTTGAFFTGVDAGASEGQSTTLAALMAQSDNAMQYGMQYRDYLYSPIGSSISSHHSDSAEENSIYGHGSNGTPGSVGHGSGAIAAGEAGNGNEIARSPSALSTSSNPYPHSPYAFGESPYSSQFFFDALQITSPDYEAAQSRSASVLSENDPHLLLGKSGSTAAAAAAATLSADSTRVSGLYHQQNAQYAALQRKDTLDLAQRRSPSSNARYTSHPYHSVFGVSTKRTSSQEQAFTTRSTLPIKREGDYDEHYAHYQTVPNTSGGTIRGLPVSSHQEKQSAVHQEYDQQQHLHQGPATWVLPNEEEVRIAALQYSISASSSSHMPHQAQDQVDAVYSFSAPHEKRIGENSILLEEAEEKTVKARRVTRSASKSIPANQIFEDHGQALPTALEGMYASNTSAGHPPSVKKAYAAASVAILPSQNKLPASGKHPTPRHAPSPSSSSTVTSAQSVNILYGQTLLPLHMLPTKRSRGRRPVISADIQLADPSIEQTTASTVAQVHFSGITKTGRPKKIFICRVPGCDKCFRRSEHLKRHIRSIHTHYRRKLSSASGSSQ